MIPKLILIFALFSFGSAGAMIWILSKGLEEGLLEYVNQREEDQVLDIKDDLENFYAESGSWALFRERGGDWEWDRFLQPFVIDPRPRTRPNNRVAPRSDAQGLLEPQEQLAESRGRNQARPERVSPEPINTLEVAVQNRLRRLPPNNLISRVRLVDERGYLVAGKPRAAPNAYTFGLEYMGQNIGQMTVDRIASLQGEYELGLQSGQRRWLYIAALMLLLFSALMAFGFGRYFLAPVQRLANGTRALADGELGLQITDNRKDELGELIALFNQLSSALEASKSARDQWVTDIAHELRTPLSIMRGEIEALRDGTRKVSEKTLDSLMEEVSCLARLVNDLYELSLSDIGGLKYQFRPCDLSVLVGNVVDSFTSSTADEDLTVVFNSEIGSGYILSLDEDRIAQLLSNLLVNSNRYTDKPGKVVVSLVRGTLENGNSIELSVSDTSPGVDRKNLPRLFDRLYRVEKSRNRATGGAGIGLAICKNIAEAHGGTITAESSELGGLKVTVRLPGDR